MELHVWCQTDVGLRRETNQDFFLCDEEIGLYIVADGMGGHRGGEVASRMAAETLRDFVRSAMTAGSRRPHPRLVLVEGYEAACRKVFDKSQESGSDLQGMGTTVVAALLHEDSIFIGNVGDSRAYLYTHNQLWQMTEDHSLMNEQLRAGVITDADIPTFASKNVITRSVGFEREVEVDVIERKIHPGEIILICSDGLSGLVANDRMAEIFRDHRPADLVSVFIDEAKKNGGDDNVTVMVLYAEPQSSDTRG